jgi:hypothetical protein
MGKGKESKFVFTRYLYEKGEVKLALLTALLNKSDAAIFWAYELYYSGFVEELVELLWKIYYDFYATLNPKFEMYLQSKLKNDLFVKENNENNENNENEKLIYMIINDFIIRPFNVDVFILEQITNLNTERDYLSTLTNFNTFNSTFTTWLDNHDYINIALYILKDCSDSELDDIIITYLEHFSSYIPHLDKDKDKMSILQKMKKIQKTSKQDIRKIMLSKIIGYYSILCDLNMGRNIYIGSENKDIDCYKTFNKENIKPYQLLSLACKYNIDENNYLSLFHLNRDKHSIKDAYLYNWLYFASFSQIWKQRIESHDGIINHEKGNIEFKNDDCFELFHEKFNYEPDEQKKVIQDKSIQKIEAARTWVTFYEENKKNCIIDIEPDYLSDLIKVKY